MKKRLAFAHMTVCLMLLFGDNPSPVNAREIDWTDSTKAAVASSAESGLPLLVFVGTDWCHHCKRMDQLVWRNERIEEIVRGGFVPVRLDGDRHAKLVAPLGVHSYPTTLVFTPDRQLMARIEGFVDPTRMEATLDRIRINFQTRRTATATRR